jgi:hypothetical protein
LRRSTTRNLTVRGVPLNHLVGQRFRLGTAVLLGGRLNFPCKYLEKLLGLPVYLPLYNRSGLNCRIEKGGIVRRGDPVEPFDRAEAISAASYNAVLLNLYRNGSDSVGWHSDHEAGLGDCPTIASSSLGATRRFQLRHRRTKETITLELSEGLWLVMAGETQRFWVHQLPKTTAAVERPINLTFRRMIPVHEPLQTPQWSEQGAHIPPVQCPFPTPFPAGVR